MLLIRRRSHVLCLVTRATHVYTRAIRGDYVVVPPHNNREHFQMLANISQKHFQNAFAYSEYFNRGLCAKGPGYPESYRQFHHSAPGLINKPRIFMWNRRPSGAPLPKM